MQSRHWTTDSCTSSTPSASDPDSGSTPADRVVVDLDLEVLGPAAVAAQPGRPVAVQLAHRPIVARAAVRTRAGAQAAAPAPGALADQLDDLAHDLVDVEVLRRVDAGDAGLAQALGVGDGDDPADHDRDLDALLPQQPHHLGDQLQVGAGEDREADHVDVLLQGRLGDLLGGQADALVDDLHADVARPQRHLLGAVGVAVEAGLADQDLDPVADLLGGRVDPLADRLHLLALARCARRRRRRSGRGRRRRPRASSAPTRRSSRPPWRRRSSPA